MPSSSLSWQHGLAGRSPAISFLTSAENEIPRTSNGPRCTPSPRLSLASPLPAWRGGRLRARSARSREGDVALGRATRVGPPRLAGRTGRALARPGGDHELARPRDASGPPRFAGRTGRVLARRGGDHELARPHALPAWRGGQAAL